MGLVLHRNASATMMLFSELWATVRNAAFKLISYVAEVLPTLLSETCGERY
jgi:hypothetical protein